MLISCLKIALLIMLTVSGRQYIISEAYLVRRAVADMKGRQPISKCVAFITFYCILVCILYSISFISNDLIRCVLSIYVFLSILAVVIHRNITGQYAHERAYFDEDAVEILSRELDMVFDAIVEYRREILKAIIPGLGVMTVVLWRPIPSFSLGTVWGVFSILLLLVTVVEHIQEFYFSHGPGWPFPFPSPTTVPAKLVSHLFHRDLAVVKTTNDVTIAHNDASLEKIVLIMDESIRSNYTDLGDDEIKTTPYLASLSNMVNFGNSVSAHNCSSYSRYMFRFGARAKDLPAALIDGLNLPGPNVWQYAKSAGFKTVYIDGFSNLLRLHSGMTTHETKFIDDYIRIPMAPPHERDTRVAECLRHQLSMPGKVFIYVDKYGLHWPYDDKYPKDQAVFEVPKNSSRELTLKIVYKNAVRWAVDEFFRCVVDQLDLSKTAIFYTSDHGQSLLEGGYPLSHCSVGSGIVTGEALVPMAVLTGDPELFGELSTAANIMFNRTSHFDLFPAVLLALGYDSEAVSLAYGEGLYGLPPKTRKFLSGFKKSVVWNEITEAE